MHRFIRRKRAVFDWINQMPTEDRSCAYEMYTIIEQILLLKRLPHYFDFIYLVVFSLILFGASTSHRTLLRIAQSDQWFIVGPLLLVLLLLIHILIYISRCRTIRLWHETLKNSVYRRILRVLCNNDLELLETVKQLKNAPIPTVSRRS